MSPFRRRDLRDCGAAEVEADRSETAADRRGRVGARVLRGLC